MTILIITHQKGFEADPVIDRLKDLNLVFNRFNQDDGKNISKVGFLKSNKEEDIFWNSDDKSIYLTDITHVWFQQPPPFTGQPSNFEQTIQRNNMVTFLEATFSLLSVKWLNKISNVFSASNKVLQLHWATYVGLLIPETCISNDPLIIRSFCSKKQSIVKNLNSPWVIQDNNTVVSSTNLVQDDWIKDDEAVMFCPLIYQHFVERKHDYRVVILGDSVFVARCNSEMGDPIDVRVNNSTGSNFYQCEINDKYINKLRSLMKILGIDYCSSDFIEDYNGNIYFLEMNICGAWWWMDKLYDGKILDAFIEYLTT